MTAQISNKKLKAIVFTDIVDFTQLSAKDEQHALELINKQREIVKPIVEKYGGEYLVRGGEIIEKEINLWKPKRFVLVKFPDKSSALKFYNCKEYKPYKNIRIKNATSTITFVEGFH